MKVVHVIRRCLKKKIEKMTWSQRHEREEPEIRKELFGILFELGIIDVRQMYGWIDTGLDRFL